MNVGSAGKLVCELTWDVSPSQRPVDADLQAVAIDQYGTVVDAAFFNNLKALGKGIVHSGDETSGKERVIMDLEKIPSDIKIIYFMAFVFTDGCTFQDVPYGVANISHSSNARDSLGTFNVTAIGGYTGAFLAKIVRENGFFSLVLLNKAIGIMADRPPRHFMDCSLALHAEVIQHIPKAPSKLKINFDMRKGGVFEFGAQGETSARVCLGWDVANGRVDLDVSCVLFDAQKTVLETVFFGNLESSGPHSAAGAVKHSGDNLTGEGEGDADIISVDVSGLGPQVSQIFFVINIYTRGFSFQQVANPYCRVLLGKDEVCKYRLRESPPHTNGLVICRLFRPPAGGSWGFQALGQPSRGSMWRDSIPDMLALFNAKQQELYAQQSTFSHPNARQDATSSGCCATM